jgi:outer membrane protein TolC
MNSDQAISEGVNMDDQHKQNSKVLPDSISRTIIALSFGCLIQSAYATNDSLSLKSIHEAEQMTVVMDQKEANGRPVEYQVIAANMSDTETKDTVTGELFTLEESINIALRDNPGLAEMQARAEAMAAIPSQVGTLPDPRLSFNAMNLPTDTFDISQEPMTQLQFGISQAIPFPGKLALREQSAEYEAEAAADDVDETRLQLVRNVKSIWWRLFYLDQALTIVSRNQELLRQFVEIAQTKYSVGQGLQQDVLLAQLELSKLLDLELRLQGARRNENARFNALLDISPDHEVHLPQQVDKHLPALATEQVLYDLADQSRPLLAKQDNRIQAAQTRVKLAEKDFYPDFNAGAYYGFRDGENIGGDSRSDLATFKFSMNLPLFTERKQKQAVSQRKSELLGQNYKLQDLRLLVQANISEAVSDYLRARDQSELFSTGIIPQATQTVSSMLAGYQVNKVDFLNLVRAQITLYNYEINYWQMLSEANQALARIIAGVGVETVYE